MDETSSSKWSIKRKSSKMSKSTKSFIDLPVEIVIHLTSFLNFKDVLSFCHTNQYLFRLLSSEDSIWRRFSQDDIRCTSTVLESTAMHLRIPMKQSIVKISYMLHRKTQRNWASGHFNTVFSLPARANFSRPPRFLEYNQEKIGCLDFEEDEWGSHFILHVWDVATRTALALPWKTEVWSNLKRIKNISQVNNLIIDGTVAIIHLGPYRLEPVSSEICDHAIVALDFSNGHQLDDLWHHVPETKYEEWSLFNIGEHLYRLNESAGYFAMEKIDLLTGEILQKFTHEEIIMGNSQYAAKDKNFLAIPCINVVQWRKIDIIVLSGNSEKPKFLSRLEKPIFSAPKLNIKDGKVFALLDDLRIPVWDAATGNQLMLVSKNNGMLRNFESAQSKPVLVKVYDESHPLELVVMSLTEDRQVRKVTSFVESDGDFKFLPTRSFKFENIESILDVFVIHDHFFVCYVTFMGWLKIDITPMFKLQNETSRKTKTIKLIKVREYMFGRKVHVHVTPCSAVIKTPDKIIILDFAFQESRRKLSLQQRIKNVFGSHL